MSFMDDLTKAAQSFEGADSQNTADAAGDTVARTDPNELADHMTQSVGNMDRSTVSKYGQELLQAFNNRGAAAASGGSATSADAASASGSGSDVSGNADAGSGTGAASAPVTDATGATQAAGVSEDAVSSGDPSAIGKLIGYAKAHPDVLKSATTAFLQKNPGALASLAPGLLQGIMGKAGGPASG